MRERQREMKLRGNIVFSLAFKEERVIDEEIGI